MYKKLFVFYWKTYFTILTFILLSVLLFNWAIDPLWYGKGNRLTGKNFAFNERVAKTNLFFQDKEQYDCLIFGSSRVTLLKASLIRDNHCFNFAFSGGNIREFLAYAKYLKQKGVYPKKIYVGVDSFQVQQKTLPKDLPDFITKGANTEPIYTAYLSLDILRFSISTIFGDSPWPRYYDENFNVELVNNVPVFKPKLVTPKTQGTYYTFRVLLYKELKSVFPKARFIGYVPPVSAWRVVNELYFPGVLDDYLQSIYELSNVFDELYDFSIPSDVTTQTKNTYDGSHYYPQVNVEIAKVIQGQKSDFGIRINSRNFVACKTIYKKRVKDFLKKIDEGKK